MRRDTEEERTLETDWMLIGNPWLASGSRSSATMKAVASPNPGPTSLPRLEAIQSAMPDRLGFGKKCPVTRHSDKKRRQETADDNFCRPPHDFA